jgi:hypothetical protein
MVPEMTEPTETEATATEVTEVTEVTGTEITEVTGTEITEVTGSHRETEQRRILSCSWLDCPVKHCHHAIPSRCKNCIVRDPLLLDCWEICSVRHLHGIPCMFDVYQDLADARVARQAAAGRR